MSVKQKFNFRLTEDAKKLLELMADNLGITQTAILEIAIREKATDLGVSLPPDVEPGDILKRVPNPDKAD